MNWSLQLLSIIFIAIVAVVLAEQETKTIDPPPPPSHPKNQYNNAENKIVGGTEATPGRYDYQVALINGHGNQFCAGTLIAPQYVLSAAHCGGYAQEVHIGRHSFDANNNNDYESIGIVKEFKHSYYDQMTDENDIMIIKLENESIHQTVKYDDGTTNTPDGADVMVIGWGAKSFMGVNSNVLLQVEVDTVPNFQCNIQYSDTSITITHDMMCAAREGKDACQGDSGGPLLVLGTSSSSDVQIGIVSFGIDCAHENYPGVYTRVDQFTHFIECILNGGDSDECGTLEGVSEILDDEIEIINDDDGSFYCGGFHDDFYDDSSVFSGRIGELSDTSGEIDVLKVLKDIVINAFLT